MPTYDETWHIWHTDQHKSQPLGVPQLMMWFTADGQPDSKMVTERDWRFGIESQQKRLDHAYIETPSVYLEADTKQNGQASQIKDPTSANEQH